MHFGKSLPGLGLLSLCAMALSYGPNTTYRARARLPDVLAEGALTGTQIALSADGALPVCSA